MKNLYFDTSDFDKKFRQIVKTAIPALVEKGMGKAMIDLMNDSTIGEIPTCPRDEGTLRGSASIFVQNKFIADSGNLPSAKSGKANKSHTENIGDNQYVGVIGFAVPYAAKMHEGIDFHFTEPSSGPKYLESKLITKREHYMKVIANTIKDGGNA